ncbi:MAG: hypothetical protein R2860_05725 [Desulfobacterales bacterium]
MTQKIFPAQIVLHQAVIILIMVPRIATDDVRINPDHRNGWRYFPDMFAALASTW